MKSASALIVAAGVAGVVSAAPTVLTGSVAAYSSTADLDLAGDFAYALNLTDPGDDATVYTLDGLAFTPVEHTEASGATINGGSGHGDDAFWNASGTFGSDVDLQNISQSYVWLAANSGNTGPDIVLDVVSGTEYKIQVLFYEGWSSNTDGTRRNGTLELNGETVVTDFGITNVDGVDPNSNGAVYTHTFTADSDEVTFSFLSNSNPVIAAVTLEIIPTPGSAAILGLAGLAATRRRRQG